MSTHVDSVEIMKKYIQGVVERSEHHAGNVKQAVFIVAGAIVWKHDVGTIKVREQAGEMKNALWVDINSKRYAISYNHTEQCIEVRSGSLQGNVLKKISNATSSDDIICFFGGL